jgi:hypothetical protein
MHCRRRPVPSEPRRSLSFPTCVDQRPDVSIACADLFSSRSHFLGQRYITTRDKGNGCCTAHECGSAKVVLRRSFECSRFFFSSSNNCRDRDLPVRVLPRYRMDLETRGHVICRRGREIPERSATPESLFLNRRAFLAAAGAAAAVSLAPHSAPAQRISTCRIRPGISIRSGETRNSPSTGRSPRCCSTATANTSPTSTKDSRKRGCGHNRHVQPLLTPARMIGLIQ